MRPEQKKLDDLMGNFVGLALTLIFVLILLVLSTKPYNAAIAGNEEAPTAISVAIANNDTETPASSPTLVPTVALAAATAESSATAADEASARPESTAQASAPGQGDNSSYDPELVAHGQTLYATCAGCHGMDALGVPNLGKSLVGTEFMHTVSDQELLQFIITGRPLWDPANTTGIDMPSRGGNPMLTNEDILSIIAYLRSLDSEAQTSLSEEPSDIPGSSEGQSTDVSASAFDPELLTHGQTLYATCAGCHGLDALGVPNLGKSLVGTEFMHTVSDQELLQFIITGRPLWDPANTTGIDMPSRGGNPMLTNEDILAIITYLRSLDSGAGG